MRTHVTTVCGALQPRSGGAGLPVLQRRFAFRLATFSRRWLSIARSHMAQFTYKARKRSGEIVTGMIDVNDRGAALAQIDRMGLFPVAVEAAKGGAATTPGSLASRKFTFADLLPPTLREAALRPSKPKLQELATFTQQFANLLKSGMPLTVALNSMTHLETKGIPSSVSKQLRNDVTEGRSLSDAMLKQPVVFSDMYVNMVLEDVTE